MVSVCIEVGNEAGSLKITVRARTIERAVSIAAEQYPGNSIEVEFPINPEAFFADEAAGEALIPIEDGVQRRAA